MSYSTYLTDRRYHHPLITTNRTNETANIVVESSKSNSRFKRNLKDKRRSTGIRPDDIALASTSTEGSANEDNTEEENTSTHVIEHNRTISSTPVFTINCVQSSFENLSIPRTEPSQKIFRSEEILLHRVEKQTPDDESSTWKYRQLDERIHALESIIYEKDNMIQDLQYKLDNMTRDLSDAEQQIYKLHQDKLTIIKAFGTLQDTKDISIRSNFVTRNSDLNQ